MNKKNQGILFIIAAGFFFALMTFFVRISGNLPTMQKAFFRNAVAAVVSIVMLLKSPGGLHVKKGSWSSLFMRCSCGTAGLICNFYAIDKIPLADANILNKLSPFFAILVSIFVLNERANKVEWGAVILAFAGALFVVKPSFQIEFVYAMIGVLGGLGAGIAYTFVRKLGMMGERGPVIVMCFSLFSCLVTFPFLVFHFQAMSMQQFGCLMLAGAAATGGQLCITTAYTKAAARDISVFDYTQVLFAALLGFCFLGQVPDVYSVIGYIIIIGSAVGKWCYMRKNA